MYKFNVVHTIERSFQVVTHTGQENVLKLSFQFQFLTFLNLSDVYEQKDLHLLILEVYKSTETGYIAGAYLQLRLVYILLFAFIGRCIIRFLLSTR